MYSLDVLRRSGASGGWKCLVPLRSDALPWLEDDEEDDDDDDDDEDEEEDESEEEEEDRDEDLSDDKVLEHIVSLMWIFLFGSISQCACSAVYFSLR